MTAHHNQGGASAPSDPTNVVPIRRKVKVPKANRPEDIQTSMFQGLSKQFWGEVHAIAGGDMHGSEEHLTAAIRALLCDDKLPRNHLRLFVTPEDAGAAIFQAWKVMNLRDSELELIEAQKACVNGTWKEWQDRLELAEKARDDAFERLIRIPAPDLWRHGYKRNKRWSCYGNLQWLRTQRPAWAALLDEEHARLLDERKARVAARAAKKQGRA
jgi:hypothetical protein